MKPILLLLLLALAGCRGQQQCQEHIQQYKDGLANQYLWAMKMYDSSTKLLDGILTVLVNHPGHFDECISVQAPEFKGKYCRVNVKLTQSEELPQLPTYQVAVCGPSSCSDEEVAQLAEFNMGSVGLQVAEAVTLENSCEYDGVRNLDGGFWATIGVMSFLILLVVVTGGCDYAFERLQKKPPAPVATVVTAFSLRNNLKQLFKITRHKVPGQIPCLHGIRVISTIWVVFGHRFEFFNADMPFVNTLDLLDFPQKFSSMPFINTLFAVDTFFVLSGFLVTYIYCTDVIKGRKFNIIQYYVYRYLRLTAPVALMVLFLAFVIYYMGSGPKWNFLFWFQSNMCKERWWTTLLYVNNFVDYPEFSNCVPVSWYLSVDMQLSWVAPIVLLPLMRWPKYTLIGIGGLICLSTGLLFGLTYTYDFFWTYPVLPIPYPTSQTDYWFWCYQMPWMRAQPYLVGMALGWLMSKPRKPLGRPWALAVWLLNTACVLTVMLTISLAYRPEHPYNETEAAFYNSLHRLAWGLNVAWIIYACTNGLAGPINSFLSWKYWQPFSKLSYCVFLTHMFIIIAENGLQRTPVYFSLLYMFHGLISDVILSVPCALLLYLTTEAPAMVLARKLFGKDRKSEETKKVISA